jgi:hypothetical protein
VLLLNIVRPLPRSGSVHRDSPPYGKFQTILAFIDRILMIPFELFAFGRINLKVSIVKDGLIEPIIVRPQKKDRFQLIAGKRRLRAIKDYTDMTMIQAKIADVDDLQARRISVTENRLRQDLSAIEFIEATIEIIDVEMGKDPWYLTVGKTPLERVHKLLSKFDSIRVCKDRGSLVSKVADDQFHKYVELVESIFKNLPKPLKWRSFLTHDMILLTDIPLKVQKASVKLDLNKAQTKALV